MAKKKGGKKGKKDKVQTLPQLTTIRIVEERADVLAPRLGDSFFNLNQETEELNDQAQIRILNVIERRSSTISLNHMRLVDLDLLFNLRQPSTKALGGSFDLNCLLEIDLSRNQLFTTEDVFRALSMLPNLKRIDLSDNDLNGSLRPPSGRFMNLEDLNVSNNQLTSISYEVRTWTSMKKLQFAGNLLTELPNEIQSWRQFSYLDVRRNKIIEIPEILCQNWPLMERMYFGSNALKSIPESIGLMLNLLELDFSNNSIDDIPISLGQVMTLEKLHLGNNKIKNFPPEVFSGLVNLKELQLFKNKIVTLPSEIIALTELERMSLSSNNIKKLPDEISGLTSLKELYVNNNAKFSTVPNSIGELKKLEELQAKKCPALKQLPGSIAELESLQNLDLRPAKKPVCKITPEIFDALSEHCTLQGYVIKKAKGKGGKGKKKK